jgi:hypothetical protein
VPLSRFPLRAYGRGIEKAYYLGFDFASFTPHIVTLRKEYAMVQLWTKFRVGILGALVLGVSTPGVWAEQEVNAIPGASIAVKPADQFEREILVKGRIICLACRLEDVRKQQPQAQSLYQVTHPHGRIVMQIDAVDDLRQGHRDTVSNPLHIRATDDVLSLLTDEQSVQKEVRLTGRLGSDHVLEVTGILIQL